MREFLLVLPLIIISLGLTIYALVDFIRRDKREIRGSNPYIWPVIILAVSILGPIIYLTLGRREE
jgi:hypothetical protein